jgi:uncharacterized protein (TIGR03437 family)
VLCLFGLWSARSQTGALRRVTNTTEDGVNVNPSLSGDGRRISFESTKDLAGAGGNGFHALRADLSTDPATFIQMGVTRAPAPGISQDGSIIAFASKDDPLGTNPDGNSEIYLFNGTTLRQITNTAPSSPSERTRQGNFQPSLTDDGRFIAFSSNRNLAGQNTDGNLEIFTFDTSSNTFTQLTNTTATVGATDAKISGDASRVAYIRDTNASPTAQRDLVLQERVSGATRIIASNVTNLAFTYGRAISDDGLRVVYSGDTASNSSQVFLFDGRTINTTRQITALGVRDTDVPLHPTISGDGSRLAFATRRPVPTAGTNSDNSVELYTYDIPTGQFARVTNVTSSVADGFDGSLPAAEVVSSLSDDGSIVAFNFPRTLSGAVTSGFENNTEIYVTGTTLRPSVGQLTILNGASFGHEPATTEAVAPDSIAVALGGALSFTTENAQRQANGSFPTTLGGTSVTVNGRAAQIFYVSPEQVNFHVPAATELGTAEVVVTNSEGFQSRGTIQVLRAAPGIFTESGDGLGEGMILNADTLRRGPFDPSSGNLRLIIFATGVRKALQVTATAAGRALTVESVMETPNMPGMDEVHVLVPADLRGVGKVDLVIRADNRDSNPVDVTFTGDACREVVINEVLADPPDGPDGDANRDRTRSGTDDEFIELVNRTTSDRDISGYQLLTRSSTASTDIVRHTFAPGTILPARSAIVVFGGGNLNPSDPAFGGAQIVKASTGGLSLTNTGGIVILRDASQSIVGILSYGGSTGLNGDANQSLTRSPDADSESDCPGFTLHSTPPASGGRLFSPGTRLDGTPFQTLAISRIEVTPTSATIAVGGHQQFTATAFGPGDQVYLGVIFTWQSSNPAVATIDQHGLATGVAPGTTEIRAFARGAQSNAAILTVIEVPRVLTRIDVTPNPATIPVGGTQQFTARGFDQFGNEITGITFSWESTDTNIATVDQTGLATGINQGQTTIRARSQDVVGTATLNVTPPTVVINEVLADPPGSVSTDLQGDANHDGTRSGTDDEFVELVNSTTGGINLSGWTLRTRATGGGSETVRHTFAVNTTLPAGEAIVVFGGGNPDPVNAAFACAQVVKTSTAGLSLTNSGLTVIVRDAAGNLVAQFTYGTGTGLAADNDQSLTRSPDITGNFVQHLAATGAGTRRFSPGTRVNGTPFGACPARLTSVTISPPSASVVVGQTTQFTAQAFDQFGQPITGATITFASDNTNVATVESVTTDSNTGIATATVKGQSAGTAHITAQATDGTTTVTSNPATINVQAPLPTVSINDATVTEGDSGTKTATFTVALSASSMQTVTVNYATSSASPATATANTDYQPTSGTLTFNPGETTKPVNVTINGDTTVEPDESFFVNLSGATNAVIADTQGLGTITNDDTANLVISQVYGGGNNSGAQYRNDFIEIFNRGTTTVDFSVTNYSVQYASAGANFGSSKTDLTSGTIAPGHYFLIQEAGGTTNGAPLPTPDATGSINLVANAGKVALVVGTTPLASAICPGDDGTPPFNPNGATIVDFVGYGSVSCYEGTNPAPAPGNTTADFRRAGGCTDTNDNAADFFVFAPNPRNTASPANNCSASLAPNLTINDVTVTEGNSGTITATFTVQLSAPAQGADVTFDIATQNNTALSGSDYVAKTLTNQIIPAGQQTYTFSVTVNGNTSVEPNETFFVNVTNVSGASVSKGQGIGTIQNDDSAAIQLPTAGQVIINEALVASSTTSTTRPDFVELYNTTNQTLDISGLVISFRPGGAGNTPSTVTLPGTVGSATTTIAANSYFIVVNGASVLNGGGVTVEADYNAGAGNFDLNGTGGGIKIEINGVKLDGLTYQGSATAINATFVAYGEGTIFTFTSATTNDLVRSATSTDTNNNATDFRHLSSSTTITPKAVNPP